MELSFAKYLSLVKFAHTVFALPFALIGFTMGYVQMRGQFGGADALLLLGQVLVCMVAARNAAMGYNRYADRDIDAQNPRTAGREIPAGILSARKVLRFVLVNCAVFMVMAWLINPLCGLLSPAALLVLLAYSRFKRFSAWCHFFLGFALGIAPVGAFLAVTGTFSPNGHFYFPPLILTLIVTLWTGAFDILYSVSDEEFDKQHHLHSIPAFMGRKKAMILSAAVHAVILPLLVLLYAVTFSTFNAWFIAGAVLFSALLIYQHCIVTPTDLRRLNAAFFTSNGVASITFAVFVIIALLA